MEIYLKLLGSALVPVLLSAVFYLLRRKTRFGDLPFWTQQLVIGLCFGAAAVFGTEFGVDIGGATANARDAAPLCAGLLFGAPAGIIAGVIGGVERWFAVLWGAGVYSRTACSVSTLLAGLYAAALRKYMFDNKRPSFGFGAATAIVMEVIHLSILFLTHLSDSAQAYEIVKICTVPMILGNAVSVLLALLTVRVLSRGLHRGERRQKTISQKVQSWMLLCVVLAYLATTAFVYVLQTSTALVEADSLMKLNIEDVQADLAETSAENVSELTRSQHIGASGFMLLADGNSRIFGGQMQRQGDTLADAGIFLKSDTPEYVRQSGTVYGAEAYWMYARTEGRIVAAVLPKAEAFATRDAAVYVNSFMEVLVFAVLFALIYFLLKRLVVNNIRSVNRNLEQIIGGDLDVCVDVRSSAEFSSLSDDINSTVTTLKTYISDAAARLDKELEFARSIQLSSLPSMFPAFPTIKEFDIYAEMATAKEVGGDFYDFYRVAEDRVAFLIADVSGKGIPAALFMMRAKTTIKGFAETGIPVSEVFTRANEKLCEGNDAGMFVTAWMGILELGTGRVTFANAGHNPPLVQHGNTGFTYLRSRAGLVLAGMEGIRYKQQEMTLLPGDRIFLYTDGVTETNDVQKHLYGEDSLLGFLNTHLDADAKEMLRGVKADLDSFAGEAEQFDDITMLMLDYYGKEAEQP